MLTELAVSVVEIWSFLRSVGHNGDRSLQDSEKVHLLRV